MPAANATTDNVLAPATDAGAATTVPPTQEAQPAPTADALAQAPVVNANANASTNPITQTAEMTSTVPMAPTQNMEAPTATAGTFEQDNSVCQTLIGEDVANAVESYLRCGYFVVPELHSQPDGKKIRLPVVVVKSTSATPASDPLVILQGGPGGSAIREYFARVVNASFRPAQDRDVILVDQRGAYLAQPALSCPEYREVVIQRIQSGASIDSTQQDRLAANEACRKRLVDEGVNLAAYNSYENAADIAGLPAALGYGSYNIYGISYGTLLAQHILARHPLGVRSIILDGLMPREGKFTLLRNANFQQALQKVAEACDADALCKQDYPNIIERFIKLVSALDAAPEVMKIDTNLQGSAVSMDAPLTGNRLLNTLYYMLQDPYTISRLPRLVDLIEKKDFDYLGKLRNRYELETLAQTTYGLSNSILCSEDATFSVDEAKQADSSLQPGLLLFRTADEILQTCKIWDVPTLEQDVNAVVKSDVPVLVLNGEFDPVTPPDAGKATIAGLANVTNATFKGAGHGQLNGLNRCAVSIVGNFLNAPAAKHDVSCVASASATEFSTTSLKTREFTDANAGVGSVRPVGWIQVAPGQFVDDVTAAAIGFQVKNTPDLTAIQRTLEQANARRIAARAKNGIAWTIYEGKSDAMFVDYAVSKDGAFLVDLITTSDAQRKALYESVFLPALDGFVEIKSPAQTLVLSAPALNDEVTSPVDVSGVASKTPFENNLMYRIFNADNLIIAEGPVNVIGELGQPGTFAASLAFTVTQRTSGRIEVIDIDTATGKAFATAAVSVTLTPLNVETQLVPVTITVASPQANAVATSPLPLKGSISLTPFENNLVYKVIDGSGKEVGSGPITTVGELGKPATFETVAVFTPTVSGTGRLFIEDTNESGGAPFATAAIDLQLTAPEPEPVSATASSAVMTDTKAVTATVEITPSVAVTAVVEVMPAPSATTSTLPVGTVFDVDTFSLNPAGVARRVNKRVLPAVAYDPNVPPGMNALPSRMQYTFDRDKVAAYFDPRDRQLTVMSIEEYREIFSGTAALDQFDKQIATLKEILATKPTTITGEIPVFPIIGASQVFVAQVKYLGFENGTWYGSSRPIGRMRLQSPMQICSSPAKA